MNVTASQCLQMNFYKSEYTILTIMFFTRHLLRTMSTTTANAAVAAKIITIDVVSDTVCPWYDFHNWMCFIGKRRLEKAIAQTKETHPDTKFEITWHPYELDPTLPKESVDKTEMYQKKFGEARMKQMFPHMEKVGQGENIAFDFGGRTGNTVDSHRLVWWATKQGKQDEIVEELFRFYFERKRDITDHQTLSEAAANVGLDHDAALAFLATNEGHGEVKSEIYHNMRRNINGVPHFNINKRGSLNSIQFIHPSHRYALSGAQPPETFVELFEEVLAFLTWCSARGRA
ncbi:thioredoxin-like protein [Endogone sp. FLAS-F59071]|nr:thioredoxin-like protein [Endogone sp. FLAS-F59071]|eukprot:RUS14043.1 thioredoxin-like protein [Endogone sp. FLAS-F59071]